MLQQERSSESDTDELELSRRAFLTVAGFTFMGALAGCQRPTEQEAVPPLMQVENVIPGRSLTYASTCGGCQAGCGILVKNRDGRPIKLEGNPNHPLSLGGLCATGQASLLGLYDSQRLQHPLKNGERANWASVDADVRAQLDVVRSERKAVRFLSDTITSPTTRQAIADFLATFPNNRPRHVVHDPLSSSAILDAHLRTHGVRALPSYRLDRAEVIVSFDADFLGTWISPVAFAAAYQAGRFLQGPAPHLSYHVQVESRLSLTGTKADQRLCVAPGELGLVMSHLAKRIAGPDWGGGDLPASSVPASFLDDLANRLKAARGRSLVLCGSQDVAEQLVCNYLNHLLQNYDATLDIAHPSYQSQANDADVRELTAELERGEVGALLVYRSNPAHDLPAVLAESLRNVPLLVSFSPRRDETAGLARIVCPEPHYLEAWNDAEAVDGAVSLYQPVLERLGDTSLFPKGRGITTRAMEVFRQMGLEEAVLQVGLPRENSLHLYFAETLTSPQFRRGPWGDRSSAVSPTFTFVCSQDRLEPVLRSRAEELAPGGVRFGSELTSIAQDRTGVTAQVVERDSGTRSTARAAYVLAADGARSTMRRLLGIPMIGPTALSYQVSILFEAKLGPHVADRRSVLYHVANPYVRSIFMVVDNADRWLFTTTYDPTRGESPSDFNEERCAEVIRRAAGRPDLGVRYVGLSTWEPTSKRSSKQSSKPTCRPTCQQRANGRSNTIQQNPTDRTRPNPAEPKTGRG